MMSSGESASGCRARLRAGRLEAACNASGWVLPEETGDGITARDAVFGVMNRRRKPSLILP